MNKNQSVAGTLVVAAGVALICSLMVSSAVYLLRPIQLAYATLERNRVILAAVGLADPFTRLSDREIVNQLLLLDTEVVDLQTGWFARGIEAYDLEALGGPDAEVPVPGALDIAGLTVRPRYVTVYLLMNEGRIERIVLPIYGQGMWSTIYGFLCLESDFNTIAGVEFYEHGETPGIGDRIQDPAWRAQWRGKRLYDSDGQLRYRIVNEGVSNIHRVDSITGASITVAGVDNLMRYWFGEHGFGPLLARLREGE